MSRSDAFVFSIAPTWVRAILDGTKTVELRRRPPSLVKASLALIYETAPSKRISSICFMGPTVSAGVDQIWERFGRVSAVTEPRFRSYFKGRTSAHAILISRVTALGEPIALSELRAVAAFRPPQSWCRAAPTLVGLVLART